MKKMNREKTDYIQLFLKKVKKEKLPEPKWRPLQKDQAQAVKKREALQKLDYDIEELQAPIYKKIYESWDVDIEELERIYKQEDERFKEFREEFKEDNRMYQYDIDTPVLLEEELLLLNDMCKEVTVDICKQKICVDQPVPLTVDNMHATHGSDGTFTLLRDYDRFSYTDDVCGYSEWTNYHTTYHRRSRIHEGGIFIRSSAELVETATVHQIGVRFDPLLDGNGLPKVNGVFAGGGYRPTPVHVRSRGRGYMYIECKIDIKRPEGNWITYMNRYYRYKATGWMDSNVSQTYTYPPWQALGLTAQYPAGTQFLIDVVLSYRIEGNGTYNGCADVEYNLEIKPYMNLEACSWEWPDQKVIYLDEDGNP